MVIINGPRQLIDIAIPTGISAEYLMRFAMQEGMTPQEVIALATTVIGEANQYAINTYGGLIYLTEKPYARYRNGGSSGMTPEGTEYGREDGQTGERIGHMLYIKDFTDATAWSQLYLQRAVREDIADDLLIKKERWINRIDYDVFTCMFRISEIAVGTAGFSVPWAIGSGVNVNYIPPQWMTEKFDSSHTHFIRINLAVDATNVVSTLETMAEHLGHHGHLGIKVLYVGNAIADLFLANTTKKFATFISPEFQLLSGNPIAPTSYMTGQLEGVPGEIIGYYSTKHGLVEIRRHQRVPATYMWLGKSYGNNNTLNPMAIRTYPGNGFGLKVKPQITNDLQPMLGSVNFAGTHGVNVNDRTAGVAAQIASGGTSYVEPTIPA